jgi:hypothetical protein
MKQRLNQAGIGHIVAVFVIVFLGVVSFAGYKVVTMNKSASNTVSSTVPAAKVPTKISTKADLVQAGKALDSSSTQVNSSMNDSSLDSDLNDML